MKKFILIIAVMLGTFGIKAQDSPTILLTGASFGVPENGWFEISCNAMGATPLNISISSSSIRDTGADMAGVVTQYSTGEGIYDTALLDKIDAFVIMHVHNQNVANTANLKDDYTQYTFPTNDYAVAYDYVIRKYKDDCYNLKDNPDSKYYGTENGKPAVIVLCTHWHDSRTSYNPAIRTLAAKWNLPLIEWDTNIGFTRTVLDPDGKQPSLKYAQDTEQIYGITFGWHPKRGQKQYIQNKMADIFTAKMVEVLDITIPVSVSVEAKNSIISEEEDGYVYFSFTGLPPWSLTYKVNDAEYTINDIRESPFKVKVDVPQDTSVKVMPVSVTDNTQSSGTISGDEAVLQYAEKTVFPSFDTYAHQTNKTTVYINESPLELKVLHSGGYGRETFLSFNLSTLSSSDEKILLRLFFSDLVYSGSNPPVEDHLVEIDGNTQSYTSFNWNTRPTSFERITERVILPTEVGSFLSWDVTNWVKSQIEAGKTLATFRLTVNESAGGGGLFRFPSMEAASNKPALVAVEKTIVGISDDKNDPVSIYPNPFSDYITVNNTDGAKVSIFSIDGKCVYSSQNLQNNKIDTSNLPTGIYMLKYESNQRNITQKIIKSR